MVGLEREELYEMKRWGDGSDRGQVEVKVKDKKYLRTSIET